MKRASSPCVRPQTQRSQRPQADPANPCLRASPPLQVCPSFRGNAFDYTSHWLQPPEVPSTAILTNSIPHPYFRLPSKIQTVITITISRDACHLLGLALQRRC